MSVQYFSNFCFYFNFIRRLSLISGGYENAAVKFHFQGKGRKSVKMLTARIEIWEPKLGLWNYHTSSVLTS